VDSFLTKQLYALSKKNRFRRSGNYASNVNNCFIEFLLKSFNFTTFIYNRLQLVEVTTTFTLRKYE